MNKTQPVPTVTGPFVSLPSTSLIKEFKDWVADTGQPDKWKWHDHSQPPKDHDYDELVKFEIPDKKRADVGMACCPICSPKKGKYYKGVLAWFPAEGVVRAIGHECAEKHFGIERCNRARAIRKHRQRVDAARDFLFDQLPRFGKFREEVDLLIPVAADIDRIRQVIWGTVTKAACAKLAKLGQQGPLLLFEKVEIDVTSPDGKMNTEMSEVVVGSFDPLPRMTPGSR